jgi:hypothetical protein
MVERFIQAGDQLVAVLSNGEVVYSPIDTFEWQPLAGVQDVEMGMYHVG